jgi:KDO2-lipid IV(A) lauroyltransferase
MDRDLHIHGRSHRHRFEGPFFRSLMLGGIKHIPPAVKRLTMPLWAGIFYTLLPKARAAVERNLEQVLGPTTVYQSKRRSFELFRNYAQMLSDTYSVHLDVPLDIDVVSIGRDNVVAAVQKQCGVLAVTGHLGMWQVSPFLAEWRGLPMFYQAMAQEPNPLVQAFEQRFRERFRIIYTTESPLSVLRLAQVLREGAVLGLQMDRYLGGQNLALPFCGKTAWFPTGPVVLARATGAPIVPSFFIVEPGTADRVRVVHYLEPAIEVEHTRDRAADVALAMAKMVKVYENFVRRYPTQWYHFYDFFAPPSPEREGDSGSPPDADGIKKTAEAVEPGPQRWRT